jgi:acylphosphatase
MVGVPQPSGQPKAEEKVRVSVVYDGRVQGIGFRATVCSVASRLLVTGYVRNCWNGTVEMVAEGTRSEAERLLEGVARHMGRYIRDAKVTWGSARDEFPDFDVRY